MVFLPPCSVTNWVSVLQGNVCCYCLFLFWFCFCSFLVFFFFFGPYPAVPRVYSLICAQESQLVVLRTIQNARDQTWFSCMHGKCPIHCTLQHQFKCFCSFWPHPAAFSPPRCCCLFSFVGLLVLDYTQQCLGLTLG